MKKTFKKVFKSKSLRIVLSAFTLALILTSMILVDSTSRVDAAHTPDSYTVNGKTFTTWDASDIHGYINFGSYPQSKTSVQTGVTPVKTSNGTYMYGTTEVVVESSSYYMVEPIKWKILDFDKENGQALVVSTTTLDAVSWDTSVVKTMTWYTSESMYDGSSRIPFIRAFLNNYTNKLASNTNYSNPTNVSTDYSYANNSSLSWASRGFIDKAFNSGEREAIVAKDFENGYDTEGGFIGFKGSEPCSKIRLLTNKEFQEYKIWNGTRNSGYSSKKCFTGCIWTTSIDVTTLNYDNLSAIAWNSSSNTTCDVTMRLFVLPAMWIDLNKISVYGGTGTLTDPYIATVQKQLTYSTTATPSKTYDGSKLTYSNTVDISSQKISSSDDVTLTLNWTTSDASVGTNKTMTITPVLTGADAYKYKASASTGYGTISKRTLSYKVSASNKTYDGNTSASASATITEGIVSGDSVSLTVKSASFANASVGNGKKVTGEVNQPSGTSGGNYQVSASYETTANITPKKLSYSGTVTAKTWDENKTANASISNVSGWVNGEGTSNANVTINKAEYLDATPGTNKDVKVYGTLTGSGASNYTIDEYVVVKGTINKKKLVIEAQSAPKIYDGTKNANVSVTSVKDEDGNVVSGVTVNLTGIYDSKEAGEGKTITVTPSFVNAGDATYYDFKDESFEIHDGVINRKKVTFSAEVEKKTYDGTINISKNDISSYPDFGEIIQGDDATLTCIGAYKDKTVSKNKDIDITPSFTGKDADNYYAEKLTIHTGEITSKLLSYEVVVNNKKYNGDTNGTANATITGGKVSSDDVTIKVDSVTFESPNIGDNIPVTVVFGAKPTKTYDGTTDVPVLDATLKDQDGNDVDLIYNYTAQFLDPNAGEGKTIKVTATLNDQSGTYHFDKSEYYIYDGVIEPLEITFDAKVSDKIYDCSDTCEAVQVGSVSGTINGDMPSLTLSAKFSDKNAGTNKTVTVNATCSDSNYKAKPLTKSASITRRPVKLLVSAPNKTFDNTSSVSVNYALETGVKFTSDDLYLSSSSGLGTVSSSDAGDNKSVTLNNLPSLDGADKDNYMLDISSVSCKVKINPLNLESSNLSVTNKVDSFDFGDGSPKTYKCDINVLNPSVTLLKDKDYELLYNDGNVAVGSHNVTVKFKGNFAGSITLTFTIYGSLDKVKLDDGYKLYVHLGDTIKLKKSFNDCVIKISDDDKASWSEYQDSGYTVNGDLTIYAYQQRSYYHDSDIEAFNFHIITKEDVASSIADIINSNSDPSKKKDDIKSWLQDPKNIDLIFDGSSDDDDTYKVKLSDNDYLDFVTSYVALSNIDDVLSDADKLKELKDLIKEAVDAKDFEKDSLQSIEYEKSMTAYERLNEKFKKIFPVLTLDYIKTNYYRALGEKKINSKDASSDGNDVEVFDVISNLEDSEDIKLSVTRITDINKINALQNLLKENEKDEKVIAPYDIKIMKSDDTSNVQPQTGKKVLVKLVFPEGYKDKIKNVYSASGTLEEVSNLNVQEFDDKTLVYFEASHFSDYFVTSNAPDHSVKTVIYGDSLGGSINPNGFKSVADGATFVLSLRSGDKNVANKAEVKVYAMNEDHSAYELKDNMSGIVNLNEKSTFNIPNVKQDMFIEVSFSFDESFKEKPQGGGTSGGGGGGASITIGTRPLDPEGQLVNLHKAYMTGYTDKTFRPQNYITREEVATIVARLHSEFSEDFNYTSFNSFGDTDTRWSKNYIGFCKYKNLINGYEDGSFKPTKNMTRAELAVLVNNFLRIQNAEVSEEELSKTIFLDAKGRWYEKEVNKLAILGILNGYKDGTFKGDAFVTRAEVINVMNKVNGRTVKGDIPKEYQDKVTSAFKDVDSTKWFFGDVAEASIDHPADLY